METNTLPLELLTNDNYADWSVKMKNNLVAQGLWDIVKTGSKPPKSDDDVVEFEAWKKMNDAALHTIQSSCGMETLSQINKISSSKIAWKMLGKMFMQSNGQDKLIQTEDDDSTIGEGNSSSSDNSDNMETNTLPLELPTGTGANPRVESGNSSDNQGRSNLSNISSNGHDKLIRAEAVDPIINEGNSSSSHKPGNMETNTFPLELLTNNNYADWSVKMKNKLWAQDLWDIVETGLEPLKPGDDKVEYEARRKMNDEALHAIRSSCEMDILSRINNISSSKDAWEMLGKIPMESNGHDKQMQTEYDNSIIDEGNPSSSNNPGPEREADYAALLKAVRSGDWKTTRDFLELHTHALTARILNTGGTVLHAAVEAEQEHIVEELVNMISEQDLEMRNNIRLTALHETIINGNQRMAQCMITKNKRLVSITDNRNELPVSLAMGCGHKELVRYLYSLTPSKDLAAELETRHGASLLNRCFYNGDLGTALDLMERCPRLAFAVDHQSPVRVYPLEVLADISTDALELSGNYEMEFWKQWIYNHCIYISSLDLARAADQFRMNIQNHGQETNIGSVQADLWRKLASSLWNLLGFKRLYEMKLVRLQFQQLLSLMCEESKGNRYDHDHIIAPAVFGAIRRGNFEFVYHIVKANPEILWINDDKGRSIFHLAVLHRQHRIFSLIYNFKKKNALLTLRDKSNNMILHMAGMVTKNTPIDHIRGAALQMQREVQWFKEVERICPLSHKEILNNNGLTAKQLFTNDHKEMRREGERWMKDTATSCIVVGGLIITAMFATTFTIPGGNNKDTSLPIFGNDKLFNLFILTNCLSLFSSSTSVFIFLGILASRYAEEDFLRSLPTKMIIGLFTLFFSIVTMMIAFSAALLLLLHGKNRTIAPMIGLASVPIILFVFMQFRLLVDMKKSTYRPGIFDTKMKPWF